MNKKRGEFAIQFNGQPRIVVFDWEAIQALQDELGEQISGQLVERMAKDLKLAAHVVAIGMRRHMPEITAKDVLEVSPPILPTLKAVIQSLNSVMGIEEGDETGPPHVPPTAEVTETR